MRLSLTQWWPSVEKGRSPFYFAYGTNQALMQGLMQEMQRHVLMRHVEPQDLEAYGESIHGGGFLFDAPPDITWTQISGILTKDVAHMAQSWPGKTLILLSASPWPKAIPMDPAWAMIACYDVSLCDSKIMIQRMAKDRSLTLSPEALEAAAHHCLQGQWVQCVDMLKVLEADMVEKHHVEAIYPTKAQDPELWLLRNNLDLRLLSTFHTHDPLALLATWQRMMIHIRTISWRMSCGVSKDIAAKESGAFFKHVPLMDMNWWSLARQEQVLGMLWQAEQEIKKAPEKGEDILMRLLKAKNMNLAT